MELKERERERGKNIVYHFIATLSVPNSPLCGLQVSIPRKDNHDKRSLEIIVIKLVLIN